jgi:hypothetical protein
MPGRLCFAITHRGVVGVGEDTRIGAPTSLAGDAARVELGRGARNAEERGGLLLAEYPLWGSEIASVRGSLEHRLIAPLRSQAVTPPGGRRRTSRWVIPDQKSDRDQSPGEVKVTSVTVSSGGATFVAMVQAANLAECHDLAGTGGVNRVVGPARLCPGRGACACSGSRRSTTGGSRGGEIR